MSDQALPAPAPAPQPAAHHTSVADLFHRKPTSRLEELRQGQPVKTSDAAHVGFNGRVALLITAVVGTMWAAYIFTILALISLPAAFSSGNLIIIVGWIAQTFLQLVLLPVIIVGQNIQGKAADKRADDTYRDAEAILHECMQLQEHLQAQDKILDDMIAHLHNLPQSSSA